MKTPTIIVRILGLILLARGVVGLIEISNARDSISKSISAAAHSAGKTREAMDAASAYFEPQKQVLAHTEGQLWLGIVAGLIATLFAARLARILTFDTKD